jgi:hypothetical protein
VKPSKQLVETLRMAGLKAAAVEPVRGGTVRVTLTTGRTITAPARPSCCPATVAYLRRVAGC